MSASDDLVVSRTLVIPAGELVWRFSGSGGPGGQHANTANTRVELVFDVAASPSLGPRQRTRLLERLGPRVRIVVSSERSQSQNRDVARARLVARLRDALRVPVPRVATRPTAASRERRLLDKHRRATLKRQRARGDDDT